MVHKRLLYPQRRTPEQFSWVDHRLVRERRLEPCSAEAWALYGHSGESDHRFRWNLDTDSGQSGHWSERSDAGG